MGKFMPILYPDYQLRFMRKDQVYWPTHIHAMPKIEGKVIEIPRKHKHLAIEHLEGATINSTLHKLIIYTEQEQERIQDKQYSGGVAFGKMIFTFFKLYIIKGGFKAGKAGLTLSVIRSFYKFIKINKRWESEAKEYLEFK